MTITVCNTSSMTGLVQVAAVAMAPDASWAVTVAADGTVRTQGPGVTPRVIRRAIPVRDGQPTAVALSGNRLRVLWATGETIRLHENVQGAWPRDDDFLAAASVQALALSPSGALGIVACADATLRILNVDTGEFGWPLATKGLTACAVAVASDQGPIVAAFADGSVRRYDIAAQTEDIVGSGPGIHLLAVSPDGETVIAVSADGTMVRWSRSGGAVPYYRVLETAVTAITVDGTGRKVLASRADGSLWLYDMTGGPAAEFAAPASAAPPAPSPPLHRGGNVLSQTRLPRPHRSRTLRPRPWGVCLRGRRLAAAKWTTTYVLPSIGRRRCLLGCGDRFWCSRTRPTWSRNQASPRSIRPRRSKPLPARTSGTCRFARPRGTLGAGSSGARGCGSRQTCQAFAARPPVPNSIGGSRFITWCSNCGPNLSRSDRWCAE